MKICICILAAMFSLSLASTTFAAKGNKGLRGQVVSVADDHMSIVVNVGRKADAKEQTIKLASAAEVTVDGKKVELKDLKENLKAGYYVMISPADGEATSITATSSKPEKKVK